MQWWDALTLVCTVVTVIVTMLQWRRSEALQPQLETNIQLQETDCRQGVLRVRPKGKYYMESVRMSVISGAIQLTNRNCNPKLEYIDRTTEPASIRFGQGIDKPAIILIQWKRETFFGCHMITEGMLVSADLRTTQPTVQIEHWNWLSPAWIIRLAEKLHMNRFRPGYWKPSSQPWPKSSLPNNVGLYPSQHKLYAQ